ncbi:MAG: DUF4870 domain-containing protein [Clostridiales bacterium]|jgi:uncharacterized membrane protein|nr:DUF4870 domain-containing protein [Clostridiales bacterium]
MSGKSVFGLDEKTSGGLCYVLTFVSGIFYLLVEKENKFVRFHALQSTVWFIAACVVRWIFDVLSFIPVLGALFGVLSWLITLLMFVSWIYLMVMAFKGNRFKIPVLGDAVENYLNK